jgi:POT family proton-dependent oligopeptide transporter
MGLDAQIFREHLMATQYLTAPPPLDGMPPGIPYIVGNEAAERFSFYGMRTILVVFMTQYLMGSSGSRDVMSDTEAKYWYHTFLMSVYFFPILGALISDGLLGKYRTILSVSIIYCGGHAALALDDTRLGLAIGLGLIALGSGGIKPCVSANVGDQFGALNQHLLEKVFGWFYFSINFGSFFSTMLTPWLLENYGPAWAFGVPGIMMALATLCFWLGRNTFVHVPPGGLGFLRDAVSSDGLKTLGKLVVIYAFVAVFWSLYDQTGSAWVLQAEKMDRHLFGYEVSASQVQATNPILILAYIPLFSYVIYPLINRLFTLTPLRKIGIGFFLTAAAFCMSAVIEGWIVGGQTPHVGWQMLAYVIITAAEVMVSITGLEFSYSQSPKKMKSVVMALWLLAVSAGNELAALVNHFIQGAEGEPPLLAGPDYYWFFAGLMTVTALVFVYIARGYRPRASIQDEAPQTA